MNQSIMKTGFDICENDKSIRRSSQINYRQSPSTSQSKSRKKSSSISRCKSVITGWSTNIRVTKNRKTIKNHSFDVHINYANCIITAQQSNGPIT